MRVNSALFVSVLLLGLVGVGAAAAATPSQQQYGNPAAAVHAQQSTNVPPAPKPAPLQQQQHSSTLPFTGARLGLPLLAGVVLIGLGLAVRRGRSRES